MDVSDAWIGLSRVLVLWFGDLIFVAHLSSSLWGDLMRVLSTQFYDRRGCMLGVSSIVYILKRFVWRAIESLLLLTILQSLALVDILDNKL